MVITEEKVLKALNVLAEQNQLTLLVQIVEKWGEKRPKTSKMAYMQAEAFCKLCLLDYAWQRLRLVDENPEKKSLQVEILLQRGWVSQAHKMLIMLQSLNPQHPNLESFHKRIRHGVSTPSQSQAQEIIRRNDPQELYRLAEQCLCFGKSQVGQKILMHLLQRDIKESQQANVEYIPNPYIQRLLWAHKGDFTSSLSLHALLNQVSYPEDSGSVIEATVSLTELTAHSKGQIPSSKTGRKHSPFVGLFKGEDTQVTVAELTAEVTSAFVFADRQNDSTQQMDSFLDEDNGTVAVDVIQEDLDEDVFEATGAFDKSQFFKEANDDEVIVLLRGETHTSEISHPTQTVTTTEPVEVEVVQKVPQVDPALVRQNQEYRQKEPVSKGRKTKSEDTKVIQGAIFAVVVLLILVALAMWGIRKVAAQNLLSRSTPILLSADPQQINKLKTQLELQLDRQWLSQQIHTEFLALSSYVYWRDFGGDVSYYEQSQNVLDEIPELNLGWVGKIARVFVLIDEMRLEDAQILLDQISEREHDLVKWAQLELVLRSDQFADVTWDSEIIEYPRVLVTAIEQDVMVPDIESQNAWIQLTSLQQELGHMSAKEALAVLDQIQVKQWELGSDQRALLFLLQSLYQENQNSPKARLLRKKAYDIDKDNSNIQFWLGLDYFWGNQPKEAMTLWGACLIQRGSCASGYTFVGKELALDAEVVEELSTLSEQNPHKKILEEYIQTSTAGPMANFWKTSTVDIEDDFWIQLESVKVDWMTGQGMSDSLWYSSWKAHNEYQMGRYKYAYQWGLKTIQLYPEYTRMYEVLAQSAEHLHKDAKPFWTQYLSYNPKTSQIEKARAAVEG